MGKNLYDNFPTARKVFDEADEVLENKITQLCFDGPNERLQETVNTQPAILAHSIACYSILKDAGIVPDIVAGLSLVNTRHWLLLNLWSFVRQCPWFENG